MNRLARLVVGAVLLSACFDTRLTAPTAVPPSPSRLLGDATVDDFVPGQVLVRYRASTTDARRAELPGKHKGRKKEDMRLARTEIVAVPVGEEQAAAAALAAEPEVEWAEPDWLMRLGPCEVSTACNMPDGSFFDFKWDLHNTGSFVDPVRIPGLKVTTGKADADIDWIELYDRLGPSYSGSAVVGILDTGIRPTHDLFAGKIIGGMRFLGDAQPVTNYTDDHGHGSHVAGIAAGRAILTGPGGRVPAVAGVAYGTNIKLLVGKVCTSTGSCPSSATANGIIWAADNGANVINLSLGSFGGNPDGTGSSAQQAALQYALAKNVLTLCATGNDDGKVNYFGGVGYPARFPECMAVASTNWSDRKSSYSNYGPQTAIAAPGGDGEQGPYSYIMSASRNGDASYAWNAGTSMATPQVTGLAALLYASGYTTPAAVRQRLQQTADDVDAAGWDARTGFGRINAYRAVTGLDPNAPPVADPGAGYSGSKGVAVQFDGSASADPNGKAITFAWNFGDPSSASNSSTLATPVHTYLRAGNYTVTLTVTDAANLSTTTTRVAVIPNIVPSVGFAGATILQGETFATTGSFADADPDTWTATVSYGDGSPTEALALSAAKSFSLSHRYMASGTQPVAVTVSDDDGGTGSAGAAVVVWTPQQGIEQLLLADVDAGASSASATADANAGFHSLAVKLRAAIASLDRGQGKTAENQLGAFINQVDAFGKTGRIAPATASGWIATAQRIIVSINR